MDSLWWTFFLKEKLRKNNYIFLSLIVILLQFHWVSADSAVPNQFELVWVGEVPEKVQVGDRLVFQVSGLEKLPEAKLLEIYPLVTEDGELKSLLEYGFLPQLRASESDAGTIYLELVPLTPEAVAIPLIHYYAQNEEVLGYSASMPMQIFSAFQNKEDPDEKPREYIPPVFLPFPAKILWAILLTAILLVALIAGIVIYRFRKRKKKINLNPMDLRREDEKILDALKKLEEHDYIKAENFKKHYFQASELFKRYISFRYKVNAIDSTTEELLGLLKEQRLNENFYKEVDRLFQDLDKVKFAKYQPTFEEALKIIPRIREYVQRTRIRT